MKKWKTWALAAALLIAGCAQESAEVDCGSGDRLSTSQGDLCVYSQNLEGNAPVACPDGMAHQQQYGDYVVCSEDESLPPDFRDQMVSSYGEAPLPPEDAALCSADSDCAAGEACVQGACQASATTTSCMSDAECAQGEVCQNGVCEADQPTQQCQSDADCVLGDFCYMNTCTPNTIDQCMADSDCASGEVCQDGVCEADQTTQQCQSDADCVVGDFCHMGTCTPNTVQQCMADSDCAAGQQCVQGACASP